MVVGEMPIRFIYRPLVLEGFIAQHHHLNALPFAMFCSEIGGTFETIIRRPNIGI